MSMPPDLMEYLLKLQQTPQYLQSPQTQDMLSGRAPLPTQVPQEAQHPLSFGQKLQGLLGSGFDDPRTQGLLGMGAAMLQASGPSTMPISTGQALGQGVNAYMGSRNSAANQAIQNDLLKAKAGSLRMFPGGDPTSAAKNYAIRQSLVKQFGEGSPQVSQFDSYVRANQLLNLKDQVVIASGVTGQPVTTRQVGLGPENQPSTRAAQTRAVKGAEADVEGERALGSAVDDINKFRNEIAGLTNSPGFDTIYGLSGKVDPRNYIAGTDASGAQARLEQLDAASFGISIQKMKGMGSLSDAEGRKVSAAFTRATKTKQSAEDARQAWNEVLHYLDLAEQRAHEKAGKPMPKKAGNTAPTKNSNVVTVDW